MAAVDDIVHTDKSSKPVKAENPSYSCAGILEYLEVIGGLGRDGRAKEQKQTSRSQYQSVRHFFLLQKEIAFVWQNKEAVALDFTPA
jgi:RNA polymerase-interacting CarD/CdnL/TRCF family regulator